MGNPCNPVTGNKFETEADVPAVAAHGLGFERSSSSARTHSGLLGSKWRTPYESRLRLLVGNGITSVRATRPDGRMLNFTLLNDAWTPDSDMADRLTQTASGWDYSTPDGAVESYDAGGRLLALASRPGLTRTLAYDSAGRLQAVTGPFGHQLGFAYDESQECFFACYSIPFL